MLKHKFTLLLLLSVMLLQGCATAIVTGAATGASVATDRRTTGTVIDDQGIEFKAAHAIFKNKEIYDQSHINITSYNGLVLMTGETPTESLKQQAESIVKNLPKVRRVFNEVIIAAPSALPSRSSDTWITSKIKTKLTLEKGVNPLNIKVVTEHGIVYLMGIVSHAEADKAILVITQSAGVQRVVKLFEYTD
ncbi:MAG: BON domain-containing protein [Methylophaga sp.]|nr:MAG: BON domain-containing protein [Methylophaga sp.]